VRKFRPWVKLPSAWIERGGLKAFRWVKGAGADETAALMTLAAVAHRSDLETGIATATYDDLCEACSLSRPKLSAGLGLLMERGILARDKTSKRGVYALAGFEPNAKWAKFPCAGLYRGRRIGLFADYHLRSPVELNALKLMFLIAARRNNKTNGALISYDKITEYAGLDRDQVRSGLDKLINHDLVRIERSAAAANEHATASTYRLAHIDPHRHAGTIGRGAGASDGVSLLPAAARQDAKGPPGFPGGPPDGGLTTAQSR